ncbi:MAG: ATP-grasp domain-containing protein [Deltaproteobacteria bacterium]|nr:ATP-grasp domain-containing protein [Deltaproteobacteria bacterium]
MKRAVLQLGAGPIQRALLGEIARLGLVPIVVDRSERPQGLVPGAIHLRAPIDDADAILAALRDRPRELEPVAVLTSTDLGVASVPRVAHALGLPHASAESVAVMNDKLEAKRRLARTGVRVPQGEVLGRGDALPEGREAVEWIVKPVDSSGSRGVRRVRGRAAVEEAIASAFGFSERVLVEECIEGRHYDVNGLVREGRFELVAVGHRFFSKPPACVPLYGGILAQPDPALEARITALMQRAVEAFDYRHGAIKADLIEDARGPVLIEAAARFHGDVFSDHTMRAAGLAPAAIHWLARSGAVALPEPIRRTGAWLAIFPRAAGTIEAIRGLDGLRAHTGFREWIPRLGRGDRVGAPDDNRALVGYGIVELAEDGDVWSGLERLRRSISVVLREEGAGIRSPGASVA